MDEGRTQEYRAFIKNAWEMAVNHQNREAIPQDDFAIFSTPERYVHAINAQRIKHIRDRHGNAKTEKENGQIAIDEQDFMAIPAIIREPSYEIRKIKYLDVYSILYGKNTKESYTYIYIEQISKKKRRYLSASFFKRNKPITTDDVIKILKNNASYDLSEIEVINPAGGGGYPSSDSG